MPVLKEFSDPQQFFLVFLALSLPIFLYFYFRAGRDAAAPGVYSGQENQSAVQEAGANRTPEPLPAPDEGYDTLEPTNGLMARDNAHASMAHDALILPWRNAPPAEQNLEPPAYTKMPQYRVPSSLSFKIMLEIECLLDELGEAALPAGTGKFGALFAEIGQGEEVGLLLECLSAAEDGRAKEPPVDIDAKYQALPLGSRPATVIFVAHSKSIESEAKAKMSLRIMSGGVKLGAIDFEITVYPSVEDVT